MSPENKITVRGAKMHNLKNINVEIPRNKMTVITGLSGSGKPSGGAFPSRSETYSVSAPGTPRLP